jgi:16S rRNA (guanine527-N7)-methyltransferase
VTAGPADAPFPPPPAEADELFGDRIDLAVAYGRLLATVAVERGLVGPGEAARIWHRHLLNAALLGQVVPPGATVLDIGSGAGLPGVPLALARPDLTVSLVEPMRRRIEFLHEIRESLDLEVVVVHARAEDLPPAVADVVVARAVAPLERLGPLAAPLLRPGGTLFALKGRTAADELAAAADVLEGCGMSGGRIHQLRVGEAQATVVAITKREAG